MGTGGKNPSEPGKGKVACYCRNLRLERRIWHPLFISPADKLSCVWVTNRTDLGGSGSYISAKVEELVLPGLQVTGHDACRFGFGRRRHAGMYTAGVLDVFLEHGIRADCIVGVSAGALFGVNFLSGQRGV